MSGQTRGAMRPIPAAWGLALTAVATLVSAVAGCVTGHLTLLLLTAMLLGSTLLQWLGMWREAQDGAALASSGEALDEAPSRAEESGSLEEELHLPLRVMARLGRHLGSLGGAHLGEGAEALRDEGQRLARLVAERSSRQGRSGKGEVLAMEALLRRLVEGHHCFLRTLGVHANVRFAHHHDRVRGDRMALLEALEVLLGETLTHLPQGAELCIRTRDVSGLFSLQVRGPARRRRASAPSVEFDQARQVIALHGGELWAEEEDHCGFGLSLPLVGTSRERPVSPQGSGRGAAA